MKKLITPLLVSILLNVFMDDANAQYLLPSGKVLLIEFSSGGSSFTVPEGKAWFLVNVFAAPGKTGNYIYLKSINGKNLSDSKFLETNLVLFGGTEKSTFQFPIIFPSGTSFELQFMKDLLLLKDTNDKIAFLNVIEVNQ
jgi:hypothetical protein